MGIKPSGTPWVRLTRGPYDLNSGECRSPLSAERSKQSTLEIDQADDVQFRRRQSKKYRVQLGPNMMKLRNRTS